MTTATGWVSQEGRWGWETVQGEAAATNTLSTMGETKIEPKSEQKEIKASGDLHASVIVRTKETSEWSIADGFPCYRHLTYWLAMVFGKPTVEQVRPGIFRYTFTMATKTEDVLTATIGMGDSEFALEVTHALMTGLTLGWNTESGDSDMAASGVATEVDMAGVLGPNPKRIVPAPITSKSINVSLASSRDSVTGEPAISDNIYAVEFEVSDRFKPFATMRRGVRSYNKSIVTAPGAKLTIQQLADADSRDWIRKFRESETAYVLVDAEGKVLAAATEEVPAADGVDAVPAQPAVHQQLLISAAIQAGEVPNQEEDEDAVVMTTEGTVVTDRDGFSSSITLVTDVPPLAAWTE